MLKNIASFHRKTSKSTSSVSTTATEICPDTINMEIGFCTLQGTMHANEDRFFIAEDMRNIPIDSAMAFKTKMSYFSVFDGHGGQKCSDYLYQSLPAKISSNERFDEFGKAQSVLTDTFKEVEEDYFRVASATQDTSGACALVCIAEGLNLTVAHCGDCRAILRTGEKSVQVLTKDHRPQDPEEKARIKSAGGFIKGGRVQGILAPSRGFGDFDVKASVPNSNVVIAEPDVKNFNLKVTSSKHATLIMATDGVWDAMDNNKAMDIVCKNMNKYGDPTRAAKKLCSTAATLNSDDVTCIVVQWKLKK